MTDNDNKASQNKAEDAPTNLYKTLFFVTAPITAILAGACVWMGVQLSSTSPAGQATPAATPTAAAQMPQNTETAAPSQTNASNLEIMKSFVRHQADDPQAKGDINAPVTMVLFSDFACPYCTKYAQEIDPALADLVADGTLRVEWYDLAQITETSPLAAQAGIAAGSSTTWSTRRLTRPGTRSTPSKRSSTSRPRRVCPTWTSSAQRCSPITPSPR